MNQADQGNNYYSLNLPANKKAKAIQKRRAAENTVEAKKQQRSAAIYLRVSSEMQLDGFSIEAQKNACLKYAKDQGYEVTEDHMYIDEAYSAKNEERPAFKRMIVAAHSCEFSLIIIHKMDRFERNFRAMTNTLEDLTNIGVRVFSISENLELANTLTVNLFGIINEHYLQNLSWETAKGKHQAAKEGYHLSSRVPFGYRKWKPGDPPELDKRLLLKDEKEAAALKHCFEMYATGNCSFMDLADYLNEQGFISRTGRPFRDDTLRGMLENPIYIGIIEYQGTKKDTYLTYQGKHEPLISSELFNQVAAVREKRGQFFTRTKYNTEELKSRYMVQNLVCCETCRRRLRVYSSGWSCNYKDYSDDRGLDCKDNGKQIQAPFLDNLVANFVSSIKLPRNWIDKIIARGSETDTYREIREQITRIRNRMERRRDAYTVSGVHQNFEKYERDQRADQNMIDELNQKLPKDSVSINTQITLTTSLLDLFIRATKSERYDIVHYLFSNIYVNLESHCLTAFEPKAEFEFLFSSFAEDNGWQRDGSRYLLPVTLSSSYQKYLEKRSEETQKKKGDSVRSQRQEAAMQGYFTNPFAPFGYKKKQRSNPIVPDKRILIIDSREARAVRKCFEMYSTGKFTYDDLADMLNRRGFLTAYCADASLSLIEYQKEHSDDVRLIYRHFPLSFHEKAVPAALAANAAGYQGMFFEAEEFLFEKQAEWSVLENNDAFTEWLIREFSQFTDLDFDLWYLAFSDSDNEAAVRKMYSQVIKAGIVTGTPTVFLNYADSNYMFDAAFLDSLIEKIRMNEYQISECPDVVIEEGRSYTAILETNAGDVHIELFTDTAPNAVNSFIYQAESGLYDGAEIRSSYDGFEIMIGDMAAPGYSFDTEFDDSRIFDGPGYIGISFSDGQTFGKMFITDDIQTFYEKQIRQDCLETDISDKAIAQYVHEKIIRLSKANTVFGRIADEDMDKFEQLNKGTVINKIRFQ